MPFHFQVSLQKSVFRMKLLAIQLKVYIVAWFYILGCISLMMIWPKLLLLHLPSMKKRDEWRCQLIFLFVCVSIATRLNAIDSCTENRRRGKKKKKAFFGTLLNDSFFRKCFVQTSKRLHLSRFDKAKYIVGDISALYIRTFKLEIVGCFHTIEL